MSERIIVSKTGYGKTAKFYEDLIKETIEEKDKEIERLHSIIKEVREYVKSYINQFNGVYPPVDMRYLDLNRILEILDKESK